MPRCRSSFLALLLVPLCALAQAPYYPDAVWQRRTPLEAGIDAQRLKDAIAYAVANETRNPRDLTLNHYQTFGRSDFLYLFETPHNRTITWNHLLRQTSDWEGTLWGKPDWADRPSDKPGEWLTRPCNKAGTAYKYNDVRVNVLALAALNVWRRPLPQVLKETIMDPIGASNTWRWFGYENSWIVLDGGAVQSVTGGGHWGGGMFINAYDMARFGYLTLRRGKWKDRQLLSNQWVEWALTPTPAEPGYGFMNWYNNRDGKLFPSAPVSAFAHIGNGTNIVYVDPDHDIVAVVRWIERRAIDEFAKRLIAAVGPAGK